MFNLERSISEWRRQMIAAGIQTPAPLEELESHLREEIERQLSLGVDEQKAFEISAARIGHAARIKNEFKKIGTTRKDMVRIIVMLMALFGTVLGGGMILPVLGQWRDRGVLHPGPLLAGSALAVFAACAVIYGVRTHHRTQGRKVISIFVFAAGSFYAVPLVQAFFIRKSDLPGWIFCAVLAAASILFYGGCLYRLWHPSTTSIGETRPRTIHRKMAAADARRRHPNTRAAGGTGKPFTRRIRAANKIRIE